MTPDAAHGSVGTTSRGAVVRGCVILVIVCWTAGFAAAPSSAQEADSVRVAAPAPSDTSAAGFEPEPGATDAVQPPLRFDVPRYGSAIADTLPVRLPALDLAEILDDVPGTFLYRFATPGWPDGWSPRGLPPHRGTLSLDDRPFTHIFTGRPGFEIAPLAFIEVPRVAPERFGGPAAVSLRTRAYAQAKPFTELKYWKGGEGIESIDAVHAQNRRLSLFGSPGLLNVMGAYSGRGSDGEYPGSGLHRGRQVQLRLQYARPGWAVEIHQMHTRRSVGAHGGVIPDASGFESIYRRVAANVEDPAARRRLVRNDLDATIRLRLLGAVTTAGAFWTSEHFHYRNAADTVGTASDRLGIYVMHPLPGGLTAEFHGWMDNMDPRYDYAAEPLRRTEVHASVRDTLALSRWSADVTGGIHLFDGALRPAGAVGISGEVGAVHLALAGSLTGAPATAVERMGFRALGAADSGRPGQIAEVSVEVAWSGGGFDLSLSGFGSRTTGSRDVYMLTDYQAVPDSAAVRIASEPMLRAGAALEIGWRRDAERGFYGIVQPSVVRLLDAGEFDLHARVGRALPELFGRARLGARYLLFLGDLDLDLFVEALYWSESAGRTLHPETGLLAVPTLSSLTFGPSTMINAGFDAGVRGATFFAVYENVLSGTTLMPGNLIVPLYPLPARRFRFGVHWPIFD